MRLKKILKIVVPIAILLSIGYWGYNYINRTSSLIGVVHKDADVVVKVDLHSIKETLILDALSAPKYYYSNISFSSSKKDKEKDSTQNKGIDLQPYTLVLYTLKNVKNTVFTTLPIDNSLDFKSYIETFVADKKSVIEREKEYQYAVLEKSKVIIGWNTTHVAIAASPEKLTATKIASVFTDVLVGNKLITDKNNALIQKLKSAQDHIVYAKGNGLVGANFVDGKLEFSGQLEVDSTTGFAKEISVSSIADASFQLYMDYSFTDPKHTSNFISTFKNSSFLEKSNLKIDSIAAHSNGFFSLAINGKTMQQDTIVSYTYDDNFNKVAAKTIQEKEVPKIYLNIGSKKKGLSTYLKEQGAIEQDIFTAFPYYNLKVSSANNTTLFSTDKSLPKTQTFKTANFFECTADFKKLNEQLSFPKSDLIFGLLKTLDINANLVEESKVGLEGVLTAQKEDVNIITQLFFGLDNAK
ncbi:hypothetical protein [Cellulophaga fucicola]|uniref:hypothetical protein n=1 Tax=Cellulophaga fucicola TaxID=76595 RepID=UPI003EB98260